MNKLLEDIIIKANRNFKSAVCVGLLGTMAIILQACQYQPLYGTNNNSLTANNFLSLSTVSIDEVDTRVGQQVRNHLIFLMSGGSTPPNPTHRVKLRVISLTRVLASKISNINSGQHGNTAGSVEVSASYEIFDNRSKEVIKHGKRKAIAAYDQTSQTFANKRAARDAENRAAKELAEQLRLAIASDLTSR